MSSTVFASRMQEIIVINLFTAFFILFSQNSHSQEKFPTGELTVKTQDTSYDFDIELDEELAQLLSSTNTDNENNNQDEDSKIDDVNLDELEGLINDDDNSNHELSKDELVSMINFEEDFGLNNIKSDYDDEELFQEEKVHEVIKNENLDIKQKEKVTLSESIQGDDMSSDFSELDSLNEQDVLSALSNISNQTVTTPNGTISEKVEIESSNVNDIAELISKLLNNKTLEITIKIKD